MKKAQGLSMNVIIIAAIALLVLVILAVIFIGRMGTTTKNIDKCPGSCEDDSGEDGDTMCKEKYGTYSKATRDPCLDSSNKRDNSKICCVTV
ncbi:hypothetical protein ACFL0V_04785 [Nanoarchaeota archaeon]